jgi:hypothetical protein
LETFFFSSSERSEIILENDGEIGYSSLAAKSIETVASLHIWSLGNVYQPIKYKYRSRMEQAMKRVSIL